MTISSLDVNLDRQLPQSPDAERAILGSILIFNAAFHRVSELTVDDFYRDAHRVIYATMALMIEEGIAIETLTLKEELAKRDRLDSAGGIVYISGLLDVVPDVANVERYSAIVKRASKKRALIVAGSELMRHALDAENEPEDSAAIALAAIGSGAASRDDSQARPLVEVLGEAFEAQQRLAASGKKEALTSGWPTLDDLQVFYSTLVLCTSDKGIGKSSLMRQWGRNFAANGYPTAMLSLESSPRQISLRHGSAETGIAYARMRDWSTFNEDDRAKARECLREAANLPLFIARGPRTFEQIVLEIRRLKATQGIRAVLVDYVQLIQTSKKFDREDLKYAYFADELLGHAIDMDVMICLFSQVNDNGEVSYSKAIEKSARVRIHVERPHKMERDRGPNGYCYAEVEIRKNNEGSIGSLEAHFAAERQRWSEGTCEQNGHGSKALTERTLFQ